MAGPRTESITTRMEPGLAEAIRSAAAGRGLGVSEYLRDMARRETALDERDEALAGRLDRREPGAVTELLSLNVRSLVHRSSIGDDFADALLNYFCAHAPREKLVELALALVAALDEFRICVPDIDRINRLTDSGLMVVGRIGGGPQ